MFILEYQINEKKFNSDLQCSCNQLFKKHMSKDYGYFLDLKS